jgi:hypothetical protein
MNELMEEKLAAIEEGWEHPLYERLLKVAVLGMATVIFGWLAENQYDAQVIRLKEKRKNARTRNHV